MRYVLVHWTAGSLKTSILTEEYVLDKTMLEDPHKEGMVVFVKHGAGDIKTPYKDKVKAYLGRVKYVSEQRKIIEEQQKLFLASAKTSTTTSQSLISPSQNRKRQRSESDNLCDTTAQDNSKEDGEGNRLPSPSIQTMRKRIDNLEQELTNLRRINLVLQNDLPNLLRDALQSSPVTELFKINPKCACSSDANNLPTKTSGASSCSAEQTSSSDGATSSQELHSLSGSAEPPKDENQETKEDSSQNVSLSDLLDKEQMQCISHSVSYKKMTTALLLSLFEKSVLMKSSVTGKSKAGRPALDREIVELIIAKVQQRFPETRYQDIKASMAQKCKDLRIMSIKKVKDEV